MQKCAATYRQLDLNNKKLKSAREIKFFLSQQQLFDGLNSSFKSNPFELRVQFGSGSD
jgi:hypothetical protein